MEWLAVLVLVATLQGFTGSENLNQLTKYEIENVDNPADIDVVEVVQEKVKFFNIRTIRQLKTKLDMRGIKNWVKDKIRTDYDMNVKVAFTLLGHVGELLRISYAGCKEFTCSIAVANVHSQYQDMIFKSHLVSGNFVRNILRSLRYHRYALKYVRKGGEKNLEKAYKFIKFSARLADTLAKSSQEMVRQSDSLKNLTVSAFLETMKNDVENTEDIKINKEKISRLQAKVNRVNEMVEKLLKREREVMASVKEAGKKEKEWTDKYKQEANKKVKTIEKCTATVVNRPSVGGFSLGQKVIKTCHTELDPAAVELQKSVLKDVENQIRDSRTKQMEFLKVKFSAQLNLTSLYGELAASMEGLRFSKDTSNALLRARNSLQIAIQTLAIVKTIFLNTVNFWLRITQNAEDQGSSGDSITILEELGLEDEEEFEEIIIVSGLNWMAMGEVTNEARETMSLVKDKVTDTFVNLPAHDQTAKLLASSGEIIDKTKELLSRLSNRVDSTKSQLNATSNAIEEDIAPVKAKA